MRYLAIIAACVFALASRLATSAEDLPHKPEAL